MKNTSGYRFFVSLCALLLAGCSSAKIEKADPNPTPADMKEGPGLFSGKSGNILDAFKVGTAGEETGGVSLGINSYLWRASLEAISFMPVIQSDSAGGVILTDWYTSPERANERIKVNIYILGKSLRPQSLKVTTFKQVKEKGQWLDIAVNETTATQLEDVILTNARVLRVKAKAAK